MISLALLLFIVMDPFGNIVAINTMLSKLSSKERRLVILRESAIATFILLVCVFAGEAVLNALDLQKHSLSISGGIVLFLIALGMLFPTHKVMEDTTDEIPLIVPIALPLLAGPSAISMVILFSQEHPIMIVAIAVLIASGASALLLAASPTFFNFLGKRGSLALERLMGMLLIMISVQMVLDGLDAHAVSILKP